jgi:16S rRNA (cytosine967-C5)-methyltransferase
LSRQINSRQVAFEALFEVIANGKYSNILLPQLLQRTQLENRDRAFVTELVYGTLRQQSFLDSAISKVSDRDFSDIDLKVLIVLRLGVYQLLVLKNPAHAAVSETVNLAKTVTGASSASFVNALLRRTSENLNFVPDNESEKFSHPQWIIDAYSNALKDDDAVKQQLNANNFPAKPTLVAWPGLSTVAELEQEGAHLIPGSRFALSFSGNPGSLSAIRERRAGVQDYGSQLVVENFVATDTGGLSWLDMCAGPGGKTAYLEALLIYEKREPTFLLANELSVERSKLVQQVVRRTKVISADGRNLHKELSNSESKFDRILIDAPCTGLGALRRRPEVRWRRTPADLPSLTALQRDLLDSAKRLLKPKGIIAYATCSPHLAETKWQINGFLKDNPEFKRIPVKGYADKDGDMQLWTYRDGTDSMFLSLLSL